MSAQVDAAATTAKPFPDGGRPVAEADMEEVAGESEHVADPVAQTEAVKNAVEPGRDIFQDSLDRKKKILSLSVDEQKDQGAGEDVTKKADPAEQSAQAVQPPPPLPKNELKDLSTAEPEQAEEEVVEAPLAVPAPKVHEAVADAAPADAAAEEEKVRKELFPDA